VFRASSVKYGRTIKLLGNKLTVNFFSGSRGKTPFEVTVTC
jgi:hypothetical protein